MNSTKIKKGRRRWFDRILLLAVLLMQIAVLAQLRISSRQADVISSSPLVDSRADAAAKSPATANGTNSASAAANVLRPHPLAEKMDILMTDAIKNVARLQSSVRFHRGWDALRVSPSLDMRHTKSGYLITLSLPGVNPDDLEVLLDGRVLTVMALCGPSDGTGQLCRYERRVLLPGPVGAVEEAQAHLTNGVLSVHVPRGEDYTVHRAVTRLF